VTSPNRHLIASALLGLASACGGSPAAQSTTPTAPTPTPTLASASTTPADGSDPGDDLPESTEGIAVAVHQATASGTYSIGTVRHFVRRTGLRLAGCYPTPPAPPHATVNVEMDIQADGHASPNASGIDPGTAKCIEGVISAIEFPKPADGQPLHATVQLEYFPPADTGAAPGGIKPQPQQPPQPQPAQSQPAQPSQPQAQTP
jgi:hypothetical protein